MKQSRGMALIESLGSTAIGFGVALLTQILVFPLFGFNPSFSTNLIITVIFTVVSVGRGYLVRRLFEALHIRNPISPFMAAVIAERRRQIEVEGWSHDHDDGHDAGSLALAGASYAVHATAVELGIPKKRSIPKFWPWEKSWFKPTGFRRDMAKAGALIVAEGERFDRQRRRK